MSRDTTPTVKIEANNKQGFIIIDKCNFDKSIHKLYKKNISGKDIVAEVKKNPDIVDSLTADILRGIAGAFGIKYSNVTTTKQDIKDKLKG